MTVFSVTCLKPGNKKRGCKEMREREKLKAVIDRLPEYKIAYIANLIFSIEKTDI